VVPYRVDLWIARRSVA